MKLINQSVELIEEIDGISILKKLEKIGRLCYKSESKITEDSHKKFITNILKRGHEAIIEHSHITIKWITDRSISHELVRHRIANYAQESQRYVKYNDIEFIKPVDFEFSNKDIWYLIDVEAKYKSLIKEGKAPQQARAILPNCTKTEIIFTMNLRELRHMLSLRCDVSAHPNMRDISIQTLKLLHNNIPIIFDDLFERFCLTDC